MFDLVADPLKTTNVIADAAYAEVRVELRAELDRVQAEVGDDPYPGAR